MATKKKNTRRSTAARKPQTKEQEKASQQIHALILLAVSILMFCIAVINGENVWTMLHNFWLGMFGFSGYLIPVLLAVVSVLLAMEKDVADLKTRVWQSVAFALLLNGAVYAFAVNASQHNWWQSFAHCFNEGRQHRGSGAIGALLGWPVEKMFGDTPARIVLILATIVFMMLITGTTLLAVAHAVKKPVEKTKETIETAFSGTARKRKDKNIDVDMGEGYPRRRKAPQPQPDKDEQPQPELPPVVEEPALPQPDNGKLDALKKAGAALQDEPKDDEEMMTPEEAEQELKEDLKSAEEEPMQETIYHYPPLTLLDPGAAGEDTRLQDGDRMATGKLLVNTLKDFGISTELGDVCFKLCSVFLYILLPENPTKTVHSCQLNIIKQLRD